MIVVHCIYAAEGVDPSVFFNQTTESVEPPTVDSVDNGTAVDPNDFNTFCPIPEPFIVNTNSDTAVLRGDSFNGTQPEDAGIYICYVNGVPSATVEIIVLGTVTYESIVLSECKNFYFSDVVPAENSTVTEVFFRLTIVSPEQLFPVPVNFTNCIQSLEVSVRNLLVTHAFPYFSTIHGKVWVYTKLKLMTGKIYSNSIYRCIV